MKICIYLLAASALLLGVASCASTETVSDDRFNAIWGKPIKTNSPLYLYQLNEMIDGDANRHCLSKNEYIFEDRKKGIMATLPVGQEVTFESLQRTPQSGGVGETLLGFTEYKGVKYPITYFLGFAGDHNAVTWRDRIKYFDMPVSKRN